MVTQIYTAPLKATLPNGLGYTPPASASSKQGAAGAIGDEDVQKESATLTAIKEQAQGGVISIQAIVTDFENTMAALGTSADVQGTVMPYLQVVAHQAQKNQPATRLMKDNLRSAADALDEHITQTLGQKSTVVREWVEALLLQPIAFHSEAPIQLQPPKNEHAQGHRVALGVQPMVEESAAPVQDDVPAVSVDPQWLKESLHVAKAAVKAGRWENGMATYQQILERLPEGRYPEITGRVLYQMGRTLEKALKPHEATPYYQQALQSLAQVQQPALQSKVQKALGTLLHQQGQWEAALSHLEKALDTDKLLGDEAGQSMALNQMGMIYLGQGEVLKARQHFEAALEKAQQQNSLMVSDVLSNLGAVSRKAGKLGQAFSYYKQSLQVATMQNNAEAMRQTLQNIAALYLDAGKPDKALKALHNALYRA